ncbi:MAG: diguanylate cyclase [Acholeplasmatales bacterium]|nr:diguanylate cyclase [Acholeplasmatales bacterium]
MSDVLIVADIVSVLFLLVVLCGIFFTTRNPSIKTRWYERAVLICIFGLTMNAVSYMLDDRLKVSFLLMTFNYLSFVSFDLLLISFAFYLYYFIDDKSKTLHYYLVIHIIFLLIDFTFITIGTISDGLFEIVDYKYAQGPLIDFIAIMPTACIISTFVLLILKRKILGSGTFWALLSYLIIGISIAIVQIFAPEFEFGYIGAALSFVIIYVIIQSKTIAETKLRAEIYNTLSTQDVLTGLLNRRGYDNFLSKVSDNDTLNAVFCDLNGLKNINDTIGHEAGDEFIKDFAKLLNESFGDGNIFRISGDEFVVIYLEMTENVFLDRMNLFKDKLYSNGRVAAFGYSCGTGKNAITTVNAAEKMMYADKEDYYKATGDSRR